MKTKMFTLVLTGIAILMFCGQLVTATDFDDGIPIDDKVDDTIKTKGMNTRFIMLNAKQKAESGAVGVEAESDAENGVVNGVVVGPGSEVKGDIIIIDEGDTTLVVD